MQWVPVRHCWDIERAGLQSRGSQQEQCRGSPHFAPATELICSKAPSPSAACYTDTCFASYLQIGWYKTFLAIENICKHLLALRLSGWCLCLEEEHFTLLFMAFVRQHVRRKCFFLRKFPKYNDVLSEAGRWWCINISPLSPVTALEWPTPDLWNWKSVTCKPSAIGPV